MNDEELQRLCWAIERVAFAITPHGADGLDANGGSVSSLTEAAMGVTGGLCRIADAISDLATAIRESNPKRVSDDRFHHDPDRPIDLDSFR